MKYNYPRTKISFYTLLLFIGLFIVGCSKSGSNVTPAPTIVTLSVTTGPYNTSLIITGTGFSSTPTNNQVSFNGKAATVTAATSTHLTVTVPIGAGTGKVTVSVNSGSPATGPVFNYQLTATVSTFAGGTKAGYVDGQGTAALFESPWGLVIDKMGDIFVSDTQGCDIRKITAAGLVSTFAGSNGNCNTGDGKGSFATFIDPYGMGIDAAGNLYVVDALIRKITPDGTVTSVYGGTGDYNDVVTDASGNLFITDYKNQLIIKINSTGVASTFAGSGAVGMADGKGTSASFNYPSGITMDASGNLFVIDEGSNLVRKITPDGTVTTIAGNGTKGAVNGKANQASFNDATGIAVDATGNIFIGDFGNNLIRQITPDGTVSTLAGTGAFGATDGPGTTATFQAPQELSLDAAGNIYVASGVTIRKIVLQ